MVDESDNLKQDGSRLQEKRKSHPECNVARARGGHCHAGRLRQSQKLGLEDDEVPPRKEERLDAGWIALVAHQAKADRLTQELCTQQKSKTWGLGFRVQSSAHNRHQRPGAWDFCNQASRLGTRSKTMPFAPAIPLHP